MDSESKTTIQISVDIWRELKSRKEEPGETFDDVIRDLLEE